MDPEGLRRLALGLRTAGRALGWVLMLLVVWFPMDRLCPANDCGRMNLWGAGVSVLIGYTVFKIIWWITTYVVWVLRGFVGNATYAWPDQPAAPAPKSIEDGYQRQRARSTRRWMRFDGFALAFVGGLLIRLSGESNWVAGTFLFVTLLAGEGLYKSVMLGMRRSTDATNNEWPDEPPAGPATPPEAPPSPPFPK